jgi:hypothetical protein
LSCGRGAFGFDSAFGFGSGFGSGFGFDSAFGFSPFGCTHFAGLTMMVDSIDGSTDGGDGAGGSSGRGDSSSTGADMGSGEGKGASGSATGVVTKKTRLNQTVTSNRNLLIMLHLFWPGTSVNSARPLVPGIGAKRIDSHHLEVPSRFGGQGRPGVFSTVRPATSLV